MQFIIVLVLVAAIIAMIEFFLRKVQKSGIIEERAESQQEIIQSVEKANSAILELDRNRQLRDKLMRKYTRTE